MKMRPPERDPYEVLNVARNASDRDIRRAYRSLLRMHHPDVSAVPEGGERTASSTPELRDIMAAYEAISGAARRRKQTRASQGTPPEPAAKGSMEPQARKTSDPRPKEASPPPSPQFDIIIGPVRWEPPRRRRPR